MFKSIHYMVILLGVAFYTVMFSVDKNISYKQEIKRLERTNEYYKKNCEILEQSNKTFSKIIKTLSS